MVVTRLALESSCNCPSVSQALWMIQEKWITPEAKNDNMHPNPQEKHGTIDHVYIVWAILYIRH